MGHLGQTRLNACSASCLAGAATALALAINVRDGEYAPAALSWLSAAVVLLFVAVAQPCRGRLARVFSGQNQSAGETPAARTASLPIVLIACIVAQLLAYTMSPPSGWHWWSDDLVNRFGVELSLYYVSPFLAWMFVGLCIWRPKLKPIALAAVLALFLAVGVWFIRSSPSPRIDVFVFQQVGPQALLDGRSPYSASYPDIYATENRDRAVYDESMSQGGTLKFGFPYPPLSLYLATAGYAIAGDHRFAQLVAVALTGLLLAFMRRGAMPLVFAVLFLFAPRGFFILGRGWTEPFVVLFFAATIYAALHRPKLLPIALGLLLASKQYLVLLIPLAPLLTASPIRWRETVWLLVKAGAVATVVTIPFVIADFSGMWQSLVNVQKESPFREDALSYLVWVYHQTGVKWGVLPALAATAVAILIALLRSPRAPAGFAAASALVFIVFFALNKQAFANYYYFVIGAIWCGLASEYVADRRETATELAC